MEIARPGGAIANRPLHFIWIIDRSGSMSVNGKIQAVNSAIEETLPEMKAVARENAEAQVLVRAVTFSDGAQWHVSQPTTLEDFRWSPITADGVTDMGQALHLVADQMKTISQRGLPPVLVLMSDGQPTDDYAAGLKALMAEPWGKKAVRMAIAIGSDADVEVLQKFIGNPERKPLSAGNPKSLVDQIKWASTVALRASSEVPAQWVGEATFGGGSVPIPTPPPAPAADTGGWVF